VCVLQLVAECELLSMTAMLLLLLLLLLTTTVTSGCTWVRTS
jgi:hypothetical protein